MVFLGVSMSHNSVCHSVLVTLPPKEVGLLSGCF